MDDFGSTDALFGLASHLQARRKYILAAWREASERDPELTTASVLSRAQFHDRIPEVLDVFERKLCARRRVDKQELADEQQVDLTGALVVTDDQAGRRMSRP